MNKQEFKSSYNELSQIVKDKLFGTKHQEYSTVEDMFLNFNQAAELQAITPAQVGLNYSTKHFVSIIDMLKCQYDAIDSVITMERHHTKEYKQEKISDMIGYLFLIYGMLNDRSNN